MLTSPKPCRWCSSTYHFSFQCRKNPKAHKPLKHWKPIKKIGKVTKRWLTVRKEFLDKQTEFRCFYCGRPLERNKVEVDHYKPRGSHPELRFDEDNLRVSCHGCNGAKGSISGDVFIKSIRRNEMDRKQEGFIEIFLMLVVVAFLFVMFFVRWSASSERVSGVVYNTTNDAIFSGSTNFSVRASEATYTSEENRSTYCLPKGSPYIELVNRAAEDKRIKVVVTTEKFFAIQAPWVCRDNVKVTEIK